MDQGPKVLPLPVVYDTRLWTVSEVETVSFSICREVNRFPSSCRRVGNPAVWNTPHRSHTPRLPPDVERDCTCVKRQREPWNKKEDTSGSFASLLILHEPARKAMRCS